jgi:hypothetical protein
MSVRMMLTLNAAMMELARQRHAADQAIIDRMIASSPTYQRGLKLHTQNVATLNATLDELARRIGLIEYRK